jgi:hypothetical protein
VSGRQGGPDLTGAGDSAVALGVHGQGAIVLDRGGVAAEEGLVSDDAEGEDVLAREASGDLPEHRVDALGRHVRGGADDGADLGEGLGVSLGGGDAEIDQFHAGGVTGVLEKRVRDQDVLGLDVAVNDAVVVELTEGLRDVEEDGLAGRAVAAQVAEHGLEFEALDHLHGDRQDTEGRIFMNAVASDHGGVPLGEPGEGLGLAPDALDHGGRGAPDRDDLEGERGPRGLAAGTERKRLPDRALTPLAELLIQRELRDPGTLV